ncbi:hypothetical protein GIB67_022918, partial [Kingdonia uniflora]
FVVGFAGVSQFVEDNTSKIVEHYSARTNQSLQQREASPIIHLKRLNNWVRLDRALKDDAPFDVCSCQFVMHYSWSTEACARRAFANISALLRPGGTFIGTMPDANVLVKKLREAEGLFFGNSVFWIRFDEEYAHKVGSNLISFIISFASCHSPVEAQGKLPEQEAMTAAAESDSIQATDQPFDVAHAAP